MATLDHDPKETEAIKAVESMVLEAITQGDEAWFQTGSQVYALGQAGFAAGGDILGSVLECAAVMSHEDLIAEIQAMHRLATR